MPRRLVLATRNRDKVREIQAKLSGLSLEVLSLADFPSLPEVTEDQPTLIGNAIKKATEIARHTGEWTLADDTGLEVDALDGAPGVRSARYAGEAASYEANCARLLSEMEEVPEGERQARFRTVIALKTPDKLHCVEGVLEGTITREERGSEGFGYDPVFLLSSGKTLAEVSLEEKNRISHRGQSVGKIVESLDCLLKSESK